jgi:hypothetical protein
VRGAIAALGTAVAGGLVVGAVTSVGQGILPFDLAPLANSATPWCLAAFALVLIGAARHTGEDRAFAGVPIASPVAGFLALLAMLAGYDLLTVVRGFAISGSMAVFWGAAALVAGPALGVGAAWYRGTHPHRRAAAVALIAGITIGEAAYGLTVISGSTSGTYWTAQAALGAVAVVATITGLRRAPAAAAVCVALTAVVAVAFLVAYSSLG